MQARKTEKKMEYDTVNFSSLLHSNEFNGISLYLIHTNRAESSLLSETDMDWINLLYLKANIVLKLLIFCLLNYHILSLWISTKLKQEKKLIHVSMRTYYKVLLVSFLCSIGILI